MSRCTLVIVGFMLAAFTASGPPIHAARTFDLSTASFADIRAAFDAGALTSARLTELYLARIDAYDQKGPRLNAVLRLNPHALDEARTLDVERKARGPRGPLHGLPVLLKANIDVLGLPSTAGFYGLRDSMPLQDAEQTRRLRAAGCVVLGLTNMSEFASGPAISTLGGQIRNPHATDRTPTGSSGGSGVAVAAGFAAFALGTDTGGSIRGPAAVNGVAGIRPTFGLAGRGGIIPLSRSLDTVGPLAAHVADLATVLSVMVGTDPRDVDVLARAPVDYRSTLDGATLRGVRLGLIREYLNVDAAGDAVIESAVAGLRAAGAEVIDVTVGYLPRLLLGSYEIIRDTEFRHEIDDYLATLPGPDLPKRHADILRLSELLTKPTVEGWVPNPVRLTGYRREAVTSRNQLYLSAVRDVRTIVRDVLQDAMSTHRLDALIGPTAIPARLISEEHVAVPPGWRALASMAGWPDVSVPAGFTKESKVPVGLSFLGPALSDARLLGLAHAFETATRARRVPVTTPPLPGERIDY